MLAALLMLWPCVCLAAGWTSYHFLARSGLLGFLDLPGLMGRSVHRVPVNVTTTRGLSMLHLVRAVCACVRVRVLWFK